MSTAQGLGVPDGTCLRCNTVSHQSRQMPRRREGVGGMGEARLSVGGKVGGLQLQIQTSAGPLGKSAEPQTLGGVRPIDRS